MEYTSNRQEHEQHFALKNVMAFSQKMAMLRIKTHAGFLMKRRKFIHVPMSKKESSLDELRHTLSRIIKRQVLTNSMVAILTFWSSTDSDHVRAVPVALLSITTNHSGARFWPQKEKTSASTFFSLSFVMIFFS